MRINLLSLSLLLPSAILAVPLSGCGSDEEPEPMVMIGGRPLDASFLDSSPRGDSAPSSDSATPPPQGDGAIPADGGSRADSTSGADGAPTPPSDASMPPDPTSWFDAFQAAFVDGQAMRACSHTLERVPELDALAQSHAEESAVAMAFSANTAGGQPLYVAVQALDPERFRSIAYPMGSGRTPMAILDYWRADASIAPLLGRCDQYVGIGVAEGSDGFTYVVMILANDAS